MNNDIDFKSLWKQQVTENIPTVEEILTKANLQNKKMKRKLIGANISLGLTILFIVIIALLYHWQMWTSMAGIILIIVAIASYMGVTNFQLVDLLKQTPSLNNQEYLRRLIIIQQKQLFLQKTLLTAYFILLSTGLMLYMIESVRKMSTTNGIIAYSIVLGWIVFNWFYFRPKAIKKQQKELKETIAGLQAINDQIIISEKNL